MPTTTCARTPWRISILSASGLLLATVVVFARDEEDALRASKSYVKRVKQHYGLKRVRPRPIVIGRIPDDEIVEESAKSFPGGGATVRRLRENGREGSTPRDRARYVRCLFPSASEAR